MTAHRKRTHIDWTRSISPRWYELNSDLTGEQKCSPFEHPRLSAQMVGRCHHIFSQHIHCSPYLLTNLHVLPFTIWQTSLAILISSLSSLNLQFSKQFFSAGFDCPVFDDLFNCMSAVAGGTLTAAEMLNKRECSIAINWQGGWHHAQRYVAHDFYSSNHSFPYQDSP